MWFVLLSSSNWQAPGINEAQLRGFQGCQNLPDQGGVSLAALFRLWDVEDNFADVTFFVESFLGVYDLFKWPSLGHERFDCATLN